MANLRDEYKQHIHNTAPDMDKLWSRISDEIDKKETEKATETAYAENRSQIKSSAGYTKIAAIAAAFIVVFAGANIINESNKAQTAKEKIPTSRPDRTDTSVSTEKTPVDEADAIESDDFPNEDMTEADEEIVKYEQLSFNDTDTVSFMANYVPQGDEYFVERSVLEQTDYFADVTVDTAELGTNGQAVYTLLVNALYTKEGEIISDDVISVTSSTPYILQQNREYLIPLSYVDNKYFIVFENAPQIEITLDGGMVFQNGWSALGGNSMTLEKESLNVNDFYFDRMKYSPTYDIDLLLTEWKQA